MVFCLHHSFLYLSVFYWKNSPPFSFFIYSFIPLLIQIWPHRFYLTSYNPLLSLFICKSFSSWFLYSFEMFLLFFEKFLSFLHKWSRLILCFLTHSWNQLFFQGVLVPFIGKSYLETKFCVLGVLTFITESFLLGPLRRQS